MIKRTDPSLTPQRTGPSTLDQTPIKPPSLGLKQSRKIEVPFTPSNSDLTSSGRLSFGQHFLEICAHNAVIDLKSALVSSSRNNTLWEDLADTKKTIVSLIDEAEKRLKNRIDTPAETSASDKERLEHLRVLLKELEMLEKKPVPSVLFP